MKIKLITFHTPINYGAVLQGYSLYSHLKTLSDDTLLIDYNTKHLRDAYPVLHKQNTLKGYVVTFFSLSNIKPIKEKHKKFKTFINDYFELTRRYESTSELYLDPPEADVFITGSDQVFNPNRIIEERKAFYLDFADKSKIKASYAGSFGVNKIPNEKINEISSYLNKFDYVAVRENTGKEIVEKISDKNAQVVLDPVFLNDRSFWGKLSRPYKQDFKDYVLYYRLMNNKNSDVAAQKVAERLGKKLIVITESLTRFKADSILRDVGPQEFLYLMSHADFIVTDSFHGVAFSIIFEKQFLFSDFQIATQTRGLELINKLNIFDKCNENNIIGFNQIDYIELNKNLKNYISNSKEYILKVIRDAENDN